MTVEEYRQRMIQAFHNADCDGLIAICVLPTEKEFEHLEWLLKNHYKKEPCEDAVNRQAVLNTLDNMDKALNEDRTVENYKELLKECYEVLPSVTPQPTRWIPVSERLPELGERVLCQCRANIYEVLKLTVDGWYYDQDHCYMESFVVAWMPLPEPYERGDE